MLGSYMEDIGIKSDQFQKIFGGKEKKETNPAIHPFLFEQVRDILCVFGVTSFNPQQSNFKHFCLNLKLQVWAADDYVIFKRMMIQKNIDLQLQALELLKHRYA